MPGHTPKRGLVKKPTALVLDAPNAPDALPLEADDIAHKIPLPFQSSGLRVEVSVLWSGADIPGVGDRTLVQWFWDKAMFDEKALDGPYDATDLPSVDSWVPTHLLDVPGVHSLHYEVVLIESSGNPGVASFPTMLDSDKVGPNQGQRGARFQFPPEIVANGVTDEYLDDPANLNRVTATISSAWLDMRLGDVVEAYLELLPFHSPVRKRARTLDIVATTTIVQAHKDGTLPIEVHLPGDALRLLANREYDAHYYLRDRAGNESGPSITSRLLINLTPTPTLLPPVEIPQLDDGRITLNDAREPRGVYMHIVELVGAVQDDVLLPFWDLIALRPITIEAAQRWPIRVDIEYSVLARGGYELTPGSARAEYHWQRGAAPSRPSPPRFPPVDLTVAGPVSATNPHPVNLALDVVTVKGRDGDNRLTLNDVGLPVRVVTLLYSLPAVGESLELMVGTHPTVIATYPVRAGDSAGDEIEWLVAWAVIEPALVGGSVPFFYWTFNGVNRQRALDTVVTVNIVPIRGLKDLVYVGVNYDGGAGSGFISCPLRPWVNGVGVKIPGDEVLLDAGDEIVLEWASYANTNGNPSGVIPETTQTFRHHLTADEAREGYVFQVPFDPYILLPGLVKPPDGQIDPRHGSAVARYQLIKAVGGGIGFSGRKLVYITLIRPGGQPPCLSDD